MAYGQSKTANVLFSLELDRRFAADGIRAHAVDPQAVARLWSASEELLGEHFGD